jgi:hypothetical protein
MSTEFINRYNISYSKSAEFLNYTGDLKDPLHTSPTTFNEKYFPINFCSDYIEPNTLTELS